MEMLDGITVLNVFEDHYITFGWTPFALIPIMGFAILLMLAIIVCVITNDYDGLGGAITLCIVGGLLFTFMICAGGKKTPYTAYEVTIENSVSLQEFNQRYEILERRGDIYVITEKETK